MWVRFKSIFDDIIARSKLFNVLRNLLSNHDFFSDEVEIIEIMFHLLIWNSLFFSEIKTCASK